MAILHEIARILLKRHSNYIDFSQPFREFSPQNRDSTAFSIRIFPFSDPSPPPYDTPLPPSGRFRGGNGPPCRISVLGLRAQDGIAPGLLQAGLPTHLPRLRSTLRTQGRTRTSSKIVHEKFKLYPRLLCRDVIYYVCIGINIRAPWAMKTGGIRKWIISQSF